MFGVKTSSTPSPSDAKPPVTPIPIGGSLAYLTKTEIYTHGSTSAITVDLTSKAGKIEVKCLLDVAHS